MVNRIGKYATSDFVDDIELLTMLFELPEKDKMLMWSEGYIDLVIEKLPVYARDILEKRIEKWEDTKAYFEIQLNEIKQDQEFFSKIKGRTEGVRSFCHETVSRVSITVVFVI